MPEPMIFSINLWGYNDYISPMRIICRSCHSFFDLLETKSADDADSRSLAELQIAHLGKSD